jgi:hypothetical protein
MNYRPQTYSGRVVLLRTLAVKISYPTNFTAGRGKLTAHFEVQDLPGDDITCQAECVGDVAEHIAKYLRANHHEAERLFSPAAGGSRSA